MVVIPDEDAVEAAREDWSRLARRITMARLEIPPSGAPSHYRCTASIALAEVARQVGRRAPGRPGVPGRRGLGYDAGIDLLPPMGGVHVALAELEAY